MLLLTEALRRSAKLSLSMEDALESGAERMNDDEVLKRGRDGLLSILLAISSRNGTSIVDGVRDGPGDGCGVSAVSGSRVRRVIGYPYHAEGCIIANGLCGKPSQPLSFGGFTRVGRKRPLPRPDIFQQIAIDEGVKSSYTCKTDYASSTYRRQLRIKVKRKMGDERKTECGVSVNGRK